MATTPRGARQPPELCHAHRRLGARLGAARRKHGDRDDRDAGRTWRTRPDPCPHLEPIPAAVAATAAAAASLLCVSRNPATNMERKALLRTEDAGRSWTPIEATGLPARPGATHSHGLPLIGYLPGMDIRPDGHGWLWLDRGFLYRTGDAEHWRVAGHILQPDANHFAAACLVSDTTGYALLWQGHTSLIRTLDAGRTWTTVGPLGG
jgi:hypothetical protein